ncbi:Bck2p LALA0_S07e06986g [Lachancea lanzarotensis]|uniref:LALA0S07e06986g1_1 n=1 Tax=Lachancea lanzarotensis TaxID=1245769 RepID=A0A0C7NCE0_9SACH|nr:uncharacterized protein LALA0_S07e06986g [Lachancea lanzarotensis]CEP63299.1 LALA0S07e06986g1_1 [Lachancea lanzarotensis]
MKDSRRNSNVSTPAESVSKWKIPHYYRKSHSGSPAASPAATATSSASGARPGVTSGNSSGNINIMTTPQHVPLESHGRRSTKSKPRKGEMVFVNYTVKDSDSQASTEARANEQHQQQQQQQQGQPQGQPQQGKKKSSKSRMLKIFSAVQDRSGASTPSSQATKRSYSSFFGSGSGSGSTITSPTVSVPSGEEVVPSSSDSQLGGLNRSLGSNVALVNTNGKASLLALGSAASSPTKDRIAPQFHHNHTDPHYVDQYNDPSTVYPTATRPHSSSLQSSLSPRLGDENDASIAFSKMFTRKRANTGGSMSSLVSSATSNHHPGLHRNMSTNSISSLAPKYSPIRTTSPGKSTSLRRSNSNRFSRDFSSLHSNPNYTSDLNIGLDSFLDSQAKQRYSHKKKQESFSEVRGPSTVSSLSSASTPCFFDTAHITMGYGHERQNSILYSLDRESSMENEILEENEETSYSPQEAPALKEIHKARTEGSDEKDFDTASLPNTSRSSVTMFSSMVNSHSTIESAAPSTKSFDQTRARVPNFPPDFDLAINNNQRVTSTDASNNQHDSFLNLYMELDLGYGADGFVGQQGKNGLPENYTSMSNALFQGDVSTIHSVANNSPATVTNHASNSVKMEHPEDNSHNHNENLPYANFSSRIMHDIDQIANSINNGENSGTFKSDWNNSHL